LPLPTPSCAYLTCPSTPLYLPRTSTQIVARLPL
jgi:hypothetical protein